MTVQLLAEERVCTCGKSQSGRRADGSLYCTTCGKNYHPDNFECSQLVIHYGPVWFKRGLAQNFSLAACEAAPPNAMSTHKPWVNCEDCRQSKDFGCEG